MTIAREEGFVMGRPAGRIVILGCLAAALGAFAARAEVRILESNNSQFKVGSSVSDLDSIQLPPGARVRVLMLPSNETRILRGPDSQKDVPFGATRDIPGLKRGSSQSAAPQ